MDERWVQRAAYLSKEGRTYDERRDQITRALEEAYREGMRRASEIAEERAEWVPLRPGDMRKAILCATATTP